MKITLTTSGINTFKREIKQSIVENIFLQLFKELSLEEYGDLEAVFH